MAEKTLEEMREAVEEIRAKMAAAAREAGRDPAAVQLCAACKTRTADIVAASAALPIDVFGENHVQELCANFDAGAYCGNQKGAGPCQPHPERGQRAPAGRH